MGYPGSFSRDLVIPKISLNNQGMKASWTSTVDDFEQCDLGVYVLYESVVA